MYNQNPNYGFANPTFNTAQAPVGNYAPVTPTDPMTPADRELLKPQQKASFSLEIPPEKEAWAKCPHKDHTGFLTVADGQGWVRCTQCGERIPTTPYSDEEVQNAVRTMRHIWQQIKLFSITLPAEINTEFMMSLPIAEKSLDLYHLAFKNFNDVSQSMSRAQNVQPQQAVRPDAFTSFDNILNGNVQPAYANPWGAQANPNFYNMAANGGYYNAQTMNGQMPVQTMPQQGFGVVQQQNQAPFGYNAQPPMQGQMQMMPNQQQQVMGGQAFNPQAQVSPVQQLQNQQAMVANANPFNANASVGATVPGPAVAAPQKETITTDTISLA